MAFTGKYELESQENYEEFLKHVGVPNDVIERGRNGKVVTEVLQNDSDFTWSQIYPTFTLTNTFTIGKECDMNTMTGKPFKVTVTMEDGKVCAMFPNYCHTAEICGDTLIERSTVCDEKGTVTLTKVSRRI